MNRRGHAVSSSTHVVSGTFTGPAPSKLTTAMSQTTLTLLQGTVDLLILRALQAGPAHGYAVSRWVHERTDGVLSMEDAALYQALHRLEGRGWIAFEWGLSENNRRAKYYSLTGDGRRQVRSEVSMWRRYAEAMFKIIETA
jgi:PadR family transcriptional regulator, regulatory protein PadR